MSDLSPLEGLPIISLFCSILPQLSDISVVSSLTALMTLEIMRTDVEDISAISACKDLTALYCGKTRVIGLIRMSNPSKDQLCFSRLLHIVNE